MNGNVMTKTKEEQLLDMLKNSPSRSKSIGGVFLYKRLGLTGMMELWSMVNNLRLKGYPIVDKRGSFWLATKREDLTDNVNRIREFIGVLEVVALALENYEIEGNKNEKEVVL